MQIYEWLFLIALILWVLCFALWIVALILPKRGLAGVYVIISYCMILIVCIAAIMGLFDMKVDLYFRLILMGIAVLWAIGGRVIECSLPDSQRVWTMIFIQIVSLAGALVIADAFYMQFIPFI